MMKKLFTGFLLTLAVWLGWHYLTEPDYQLRTVSYTVRSGDTVWELACRYMGKQNKHSDVRGLVLSIQESNGLTALQCSRLQPGMVLRIPLETAK